VTDTAKAFVKEAEGLKETAESKVIEVIKEVEERITDVAPAAGAAVKKVTAILTDDKPIVKKAPKAKKDVAKKAAPKAKATKKAPKAKKVTKTTTAKAATSKQVAIAKETVDKTPTPAISVATKATVVDTTQVDDLKVIEGVGPKLAQMLVEAGITSYAILANAEVADIQKILDAAGSRYKMHNPTSWPLQARFARDGKFEALKSWQQNNDAQKA